MVRNGEITFACPCGAQLTVDADLVGRQVLCPKCREPRPVPAATEPLEVLLAAPAGAGAESPPPPPWLDPNALEPVRTEAQFAGNELTAWKLVCWCGKHIQTPPENPRPSGRCPKCGRRLRLPGWRAVARESSPSGATPTEGAKEEPLTVLAVAAEPARGSRPAPSPAESGARAAALQAADRMRAGRAATASGRGSAAGLVSAWPLAGRLPRLLAGFIDVTLALVLMAGAALVSVHWAVALGVFFGAALLNDVPLQLLGGGVGKRLVVLVIRRQDGMPASAKRLALRGLLKWLLFPGWVWVLFDPAQRALHDLICGTLVLKGRSEH